MTRTLTSRDPDLGRRDEYGRALGDQLRDIRRQRGLSLPAVERKSGGRWKAAVIASYERGDRAVRVSNLAELADLYGVPVAALLPERRASQASGATRIVLDLGRLQQRPTDQIGPLARFAATIQRQRGDYNGKVLSLRATDLRALSVIYDASPNEVLDRLSAWDVLMQDGRPPP